MAQLRLASIARIGLAGAAVTLAVVPASHLVAAAAAPEAAPAAAKAAGNVDKGREAFATWSCGTCHSLADAQAGGQVGPSLDNRTLTEAVIINRVTNGQGAMPAFGGQMSDQEIADVAAYIKAVAK